MVNFSIAVIAKNEVKGLPRLIASLKEFRNCAGEVLIYDTGSTDGTQDKAIGLGCRVIEVGDKHVITIDAETAEKINAAFVIEDDLPITREGHRIFNYAEARNSAAEYCSSDMIFMPDGHETFTALNLDKICSLINKGKQHLEYNFVFTRDQFGNELVKLRNCRFYNRKSFKWVGVIHEALTGEGPSKFLGEETLKLEHCPTADPVSHDHYLPGLAYDHYLRPDDIRVTHYFGRELLYSGRYKSAIKRFEKHISMNGWIQEQAQSMIFIAQCYEHLQNEDEQVYWLLKAFTKDSTRRESLMQLCEFYKKKKDYQKVVCYAEAALTIPLNGYYLNDMRHYSDLPHAYLYWAYWYLGCKNRSKEHFEKAMVYNPNSPQYLSDAKFYEKGEINE